MTKPVSKKPNKLTQQSIDSLSFRELIDAGRIELKSLNKLHTILEIPLRTLEDWKAGRRKPNSYTEKLVTEQLKKILR